MGINLLIIKLSSIGDIIHTFPAILEARTNINNLSIDWLVDESLAEVVALLNNNNNLINNILTVPLRATKQHKNFSNIKKVCLSLLKLRTKKYDLIIDPQGLLKSALLTTWIPATQTIGLDYSSAREPLASLCYTNKYKITANLHAIEKIRTLFSLALKYKIDCSKSISNIYNSLNKEYFPKLPELENINNYIVFLHGTTWETKKWEVTCWDELAKLINLINNTKIVLIYADNNPQEQQLAQYLSNNNNVIVLPVLNIEKITRLLANSLAVVAVDTGFAHLSAALNIPIISIYGATSANMSGIFGTKSVNLQSTYHCSPCFAKQCIEYKYHRSTIKQPCMQVVQPTQVFEQLQQLINNS